MKKTALLLVVFALCAATQSYAATTSAAATAAAATPQQNRMKSCAAQYHQKGIAKSQYHAFMSKCLKTSGATTVAAKPKKGTAEPAAPATAQ